jgi:hypothetical protein
MPYVIVKNVGEILYVEVYKPKWGLESHVASANSGPAHTHMSRRISDME